MGNGNKCCICFCAKRSKIGKGRSFYKIPECTKRRFSDGDIDRDKVLIEKRRSLWMQLVERNLHGKPFNYFVCSNHFVSGSCYVYFSLLFFPFILVVCHRETCIFVFN